MTGYNNRTNSQGANLQSPRIVLIRDKNSANPTKSHSYYNTIEGIYCAIRLTLCRIAYMQRCPQPEVLCSVDNHAVNFQDYNYTAYQSVRNIHRLPTPHVTYIK